MLDYIVKRLLMLVPVLLGVSLIVFIVMQILPGDPVEIRLGESATPEMVQDMRRELGLDKPLVVQYLIFVKNALRFDFGRSIRSDRLVTEEFMLRYPTTILLAVSATVIFLLIGIPLGIVAAVNRGSVWDGMAILISLIGISMPGFWLGLLLIWYFAVELNWLPAFGLSSPIHLIMPAFTLASFGIAYTARYTRSSVLEELMQEYVTTAKSKGLRKRIVLYRHVLRNALIPIVTQTALGFGYMLGGSVVVEIVFSINGVGKLIVEAILFRDFPVVQGGVILLGFNFVLVNLIADLAYGIIDPRVRVQ